MFDSASGVILTFGNWSAGRTKSQKPRTRSPSPPSSMYAWLKASRHSLVIGCSTPSMNIVEERSMIRSGAPFITSRYRSSCRSSVSCTDTCTKDVLVPAEVKNLVTLWD